MAFTEKTPQYKPCVKLIEVISPKSKTSHTDVVGLTLPTEDDDTIKNNNDTLFVKDKNLQQEGETKNLQEDEEHESNGEENIKDGKQSEI